MSWTRSIIKEGKKQCRLCNQWKDIELFGTFLEKRNFARGLWIAPRRYINSRCKSCARNVSSLWQKTNKETLNARWVVLKESMLRQIRDGYGNKCACCSEDNPLFLTVDHVNNDGYKIRPRNKNGNYAAPFTGHYYKQIIKAGFPKELQLLCWNCNCGKARNKGICPHKK